MGMILGLPLSLDNALSVDSFTSAISGLLLRSHSNASSKIGPRLVVETDVGVFIDLGNAESTCASGLLKFSTEGLFFRNHSIDSSSASFLSIGFDSPPGVGTPARFASA